MSAVVNTISNFFGDVLVNRLAQAYSVLSCIKAYIYDRAQVDPSAIMEKAVNQIKYNSAHNQNGFRKLLLYIIILYFSFFIPEGMFYDTGCCYR